MLRDPAIAHTVHYVVEWAAIAAGVWMYRHERRRQQAGSLLAPGNYAILAGCLLGAAVGNKAAFWIENPHLWSEQANGAGLWLTGKSVLGALLGGWMGVEIAKRCAGITRRTGDDFVRPILLGLCIGRVGCFLAGLHDGTHGLPTDLPWGVDLGDGVRRHPVPLYESAAALLALITWPRWHVPLATASGQAFRVLLLGYLLWRLGIDTLKPVPYTYPLGWSGLQWISATGALVLLLGFWRDHARARRV